jgi:hypothetical protein
MSLLNINFADLADDMACAKAYLKHCVRYILEVSTLVDYVLSGEDVSIPHSFLSVGLADDMACAAAYLKHCVRYIMEDSTV